jgi:predicted metal-binding protein
MPTTHAFVSECKQFFSEYQSAVLFHFSKSVDKPEDRHPRSKEVNERLLAIEKAVFLSGYHKAFILLMNECQQCSECTRNANTCKHPESVRPLLDSMAVDVFTTVRKNGFPIEVLTDYNQMMNRYAMLMVDKEGLTDKCYEDICRNTSETWAVGETRCGR